MSSLGDWVGFVAVAALVKRLGGDVGAYAVAGVMVARMLPALLFGPIAGVLVDRMDRKKMMIVADLSRAALYATMPFLGKLYRSSSCRSSSNASRCCGVRRETRASRTSSRGDSSRTRTPWVSSRHTAPCRWAA